MKDGLIPKASPTFSGGPSARWMLVGQAPGAIELETHEPFSGRAGKELDRWVTRARFDGRDDFRAWTYICAMARCYFGKSKTGAGDLKPPRRAVENCSRWLDAELDLIQPTVIIAVGQMAIERFLGKGSLDERVGKVFGRDPKIVPLPHPSGQSRWLNDPAHREALELALAELGRLRARERSRRSAPRP